jgi:GNAT superfamily N-acetyltransferase
MSLPQHRGPGGINAPPGSCQVPDSLKVPMHNLASIAQWTGQHAVSQYSIRRSTVDDAAVIARHRVAMFTDMGDVPTEDLSNDLLERSTRALAAYLADGSYVGWLAITADGDVIAGAGVHIKPQLPRISYDHARVEDSPVPLAVNVYTEPQWRKRGIARVLMKVAMEWASSQGADRVVLHASDAGRPLYESLGYHVTNEMRWFVGSAGTRTKDHA